MNDATRRHLEWRHFRDLIEQGIPAVQPVSGSPLVHVFVDEDGSRIGLRTPFLGAQSIEPSPVAEIHLGLVAFGGQTMFEVSTRASGLFAEFYALVEELADRMQLKGEAPEAAFTAMMSNWKALLRPTDRMSDEQRLGLFGELMVLGRILETQGAVAFAAWTGPMGEPHDFRVGINEIEVKTTSTRKRVHLISSLEQLEPSPGRKLYLLSIQLEPAGHAAGKTLPELIDVVRGKLSAGSLERDKFEAFLLVGWRFSDVHAPLYQDRFQLRSHAVLVEIVEEFPRLTPTLIASLPQANRISDVQYRVAVDGLGWADGSAEFNAVLPGEMPS